MKTQRGYTLIETLVAMLILVMLSASGLYGWQYWQQSQRLWQTASQARDYLLYLREDANWHNRDHSISVIREGTLWCLVSSVAGANTCHGSSPLVFVPRWPEVEMSDLTPSLAFFGLRNTAWAGIFASKTQRASGGWWFRRGEDSGFVSKEKQKDACKRARFFSAGSVDCYGDQ